jgi:hypothetical protein
MSFFENLVFGKFVHSKLEYTFQPLLARGRTRCYKNKLELKCFLNARCRSVNLTGIKLRCSVRERFFFLNNSKFFKVRLLPCWISSDTNDSVTF